MWKLTLVYVIYKVLKKNRANKVRKFCGSVKNFIYLGRDIHEYKLLSKYTWEICPHALYHIVPHIFQDKSHNTHSPLSSRGYHNVQYFFYSWNFVT
jgi:hypothetical protein